MNRHGRRYWNEAHMPKNLLWSSAKCTTIVRKAFYKDKTALQASSQKETPRASEADMPQGFTQVPRPKKAILLRTSQKWSHSHACKGSFFKAAYTTQAKTQNSTTCFSASCKQMLKISRRGSSPLSSRKVFAQESTIFFFTLPISPWN